MNEDQLGLTELGFRQCFAAQLPLEEPALVPARVLRVERSGIELLGEHLSVHAPLGASWFRGGPEDRPTVGDWVLYDRNAERVVRLLERATLFARRGADGGDIQLVAANVDVVFLVTSCNREFSPARLERYLALALEAGAAPVVVLTKADLCEDAEAFVAAARSLRRDLVVEIANGLDPETLAGVRAWCTPGATVALLGSSGVGKSTLLNGLSGEARATTGAVRAADARGRHTTTKRALHRLPGGAWMLDSPGMRELGLVDAGDGLREAFDEIDALAGNCRFADCAHETEPGCAVQAAIAAGGLDAGRLARWRKLAREERNATESIAERRSRQRDFEKHVRRVVRAKTESRR
ncbi:MAG: ribosome small subunit-dependent GTPase A [Pseudomonadales bacterium]|nr:ribosome small subunit-dependent GTPase A [Pseudomonadales bacterium]